jgi:acyl-CoA thioesterase
MLQRTPVDVRDFLGLRPTHNPHRWVLPVTPGICTRVDFLFGGCGLAACVAAMEATTGRPLVWATAQYLAYAAPGSYLDIDVVVPVAGKQTTQARAVGHVNDREILTVNAALGRRDLPVEGQWPEMPDVPPPDACPPMPPWPGPTDRIDSRFEIRVARGTPLRGRPQAAPSADGRSALWVRVPEGVDVTAGALAIVADWMPSGIGQALGRLAGGNSLDNTLRILRPVPTTWVLCDIRIDGVHDGFAHGHILLWSQDGVLMATGGQSAIVRLFDDVPRR